jgi:hypothetical protein
MVRSAGSVGVTMSKRVLIVLSVALICLTLRPVTAAETAATDASIRQLLEATHARQLVDTLMTQMDGMMKQAMQQVTGGQPASPEVQKIYENTHAEIVATMREQMTWEKVEPMYLRIYKKTFSESEVQAMVGFYKSPTGQAVITKLPVVMQESMNESMQMLKPVIQRVQQMQQEMLAEMKKKQGGQG